jgi:hypothetical protein
VGSVRSRPNRCPNVRARSNACRTVEAKTVGLRERFKSSQGRRDTVETRRGRSCASCPPRSLRVQGSSTSFDRCPPEPRVVATLVRPPGVPAVGWSWCGQVRSAVSGVASAARLTGHPRRTRASRDRDAAMGAGGSRQALDSRATSSMLHGCMASRLAHEQAPACSQPSVHPYPSRHRALRARGERGRRT